jgi:predicted transcriptional regulator
MADTRFTNRELDVMSILWRTGSGTVAEVREELEDELAYTSVLWMLQTLDEKGFVRREREGRAHRYYPLVEPQEAGAGAIERIVDKVFHGSAVTLARLISERDISAAELTEMRDLLDRRIAELQRRRKR